MPGRRKKKIKYKGILLLICLFLVLIYVFLFSPLFKIRAIEVLENKEVEAGEIENKFNYGNIILATKENIKNDLIKKIPKIADIEVSKNFIKRSISLLIKERERMGIICQISSSADSASEVSSAKGAATEDKGEIKDCFYIDKQGFIFEDAPQTSGSLILLIKDYSQRDFYLGKEVFEEKIMEFISKIKENLFLETGVRVLDFNILSYPAKELKVMTGEGWYILFDLEREAESQILALKAALQEKIPNRQGLEYVDLKIENRIYYK